MRNGKVILFQALGQRLGVVYWYGRMGRARGQPEIINPLEVGGGRWRRWLALFFALAIVYVVGLAGWWYRGHVALTPPDNRGSGGPVNGVGLPAADALPAPETGATFIENGRTFREYGRGYETVAIGLAESYSAVGGQLAYLARDGGRTVAVFGGAALESSAYGDVLHVLDVGGRPTLVVLKPQLSALGGFGAFLVRDNQRSGDQYAFVRTPADVNGKLAFVGLAAAPDAPDGQRAVIWYDGREYGGSFSAVAYPFAYVGKLAFFASGGASGALTQVIVVGTDGREAPLPAALVDGMVVRDSGGRVVFAPDAGKFRDVAVIDGKLATLPWPQNNKSAAAYDGQTLGAEYDDVREIAGVNGHLALLVFQDGKGLIIYDGQAYGHHYDFVYGLPGDTADFSSERLGSPAFSAVKQVGSVGGKLAYVATVGLSADLALKNIVVVEE